MAAAIPRTAPLAAAQARGQAHSKLCGSTIEVGLNVADGTISDYAQSVKACLLGQASAAVVGREIVGTPIEEFRSVSQTMRRILKENGPPPAGRWADLAVLEPVREVKGRHASTLLVFDAVEDAIGQIEARRADEGDALTPQEHV